MTIREATQQSVLMGNAALVDLVGDRVFPEVLPSDPVLPAITYQLISSPRNQTQTGPSGTKPRYRWTCYDLTYDGAVDVAIALAKAVGGFQAWVDDENDNREPTTGLFRRRLETLAWTNAPEEIP